MFVRASVIVLFVLTIWGCASNPRSVGVGEGLLPAPELGIVVDENLRVVDIEAQSAAEKAGIQLGDTLVDLIWISWEAADEPPAWGESGIATPMVENAILVDNTTPIAETDVLTESPLVIVTPTALYPEVDTSTIPFIEKDRVRPLVHLHATLRIRVNREGQILELTIQPSRRVGHPNRPDLPTITPVMPPYDYF